MNKFTRSLLQSGIVASVLASCNSVKVTEVSSQDSGLPPLQFVSEYTPDGYVRASDVHNRPFSFFVSVAPRNDGGNFTKATAVEVGVSRRGGNIFYCARVYENSLKPSYDGCAEHGKETMAIAVPEDLHKALKL